jgi:DNA repair protein RadC
MKTYRVARYRIALVREGSIPTEWDKIVRQPRDVAELMAPLVSDLDRETFWVLALNGKNAVIGLNLVSVGSLTAALVHPRELAKSLILANAAATVVVHNHPSGDPSPSAEDIALTRRLCEVGELLGVRLLDHIIVTGEGRFYSLADAGHLGSGR